MYLPIRSEKDGPVMLRALVGESNYSKLPSRDEVLWAGGIAAVNHRERVEVFLETTPKHHHQSTEDVRGKASAKKPAYGTEREESSSKPE